MRVLLEKPICRFFFCVALLFFAAFSGCAVGVGGDALETSSEVGGADAEEDLASASDEETVVWKIYYPDYIAIWQEPLNRLLDRKGAPYRVKIEAYHTVGEGPREETADALEQMSRAGEQADVIAVPDSIYTTMADRGLLLPLDDFLGSGQGAELADALPARDLMRCRYKGVCYGVSAHLRTVSAIAYNKELLEKYGIDVSDLSSDIFENEAALQTIKDGEGKGVIPYAYNDEILSELGMWKVEPAECLAYTKSGKAVNVFETEELREMLQKLKGLKDKGLLAFVSESGYGPFFATGVKAHREDPFESVFSYVTYAGQKSAAETVVVPDMARPQVAPFWGDAQIAVASWSRNKDYALDFLTRLYTDPEIANLILYGNEGKEYTLRDGVASRLPLSPLWVFGEHYTNALIAYPQEDVALDPMAFQERYYEQCEPNIPDGFRFDPSPVAEEVDATNAVYFENMEELRLSEEVGDLFLLKAADIDGVLSVINAKLKAAGIDRVIEEFDRQLTEWRANYEG